jgi:polyisoprenoid-binding protein YceI
MINRKLMRLTLATAALTVALSEGHPLGAAAPRAFAVDAEQSRALIDVGKSGGFSFAGHTHEVEAPLTRGVIHLDADDASHDDVRLEFNAAAMRVTGKGESASDVPKVTATMLSETVLDAGRYPSITFESTSVTAKGPPASASLDLSVTGRLTIHGKAQTVTVPVSVTVTGDRLTAAGRFVIKQTDYGITPISVGGVIKVKNELNITFAVTARER